MQTINLDQKFDQFSKYWTPHIVAEANGQHVRLAKLKDEFVWHAHQDEDELFIVVKGTLTVNFRDRVETVQAGEMLVIPKGVEHMPEAKEEVYLINITKAETSHTGDTESEIRVEVSDMPKI
ncbi:cupin domain-containing protein [Sneathiella limimaris]|uniref:cupin domain-containing protein n=1 Tax=Sneathiella limimaris TaxID=1964213 RepID=UPI00146B37E6|nr:cupin domain-containing protein [Sneathiella limimaris]